MSANYTATTNACKLCRPLGAALAFRGIEGCVPFLHGSQGCATYMRRYIISHFNEPIDIGSSSLGEKQAVYGGGANLKLGLNNVTAKYEPSVIGIASTCLTETIGDDVPHILREYTDEFMAAKSPTLIDVSTPSYSGTHMEGFHGAVKAIVEQLTKKTKKNGTINLFPGFISPADIRHLKEIAEDFGTECTILPDISETLDGIALREYPLIPKGGTPMESIVNMGGAIGSIECGATLPKESAGSYLEDKFEVPLHRMGLPIGIRQSDIFFETLSKLTGKEIPQRYVKARGRLIDGMVDGHKYLFGKKAVIYGEEDLVVGLTSFLAEIGVQPVLCASGGKSGALEKSIKEVLEDIDCEIPMVLDNADFYDIEKCADSFDVDLFVGHSKGYSISRKKKTPLVRVGFPIHDRVGGQRLHHLCYLGAQQLFDRITNTLISHRQESSSIGYSYM